MYLSTLKYSETSELESTYINAELYLFFSSLIITVIKSKSELASVILAQFLDDDYNKLKINSNNNVIDNNLND